MTWRCVDGGRPDLGVALRRRAPVRARRPRPARRSARPARRGDGPRDRCRRRPARPPRRPRRRRAGARHPRPARTCASSPTSRSPRSQRPDFREATSAPEISFEVVEPDERRRAHRLARPRGDRSTSRASDPAARRARGADPRPRVPGPAERHSSSPPTARSSPGCARWSTAAGRAARARAATGSASARHDLGLWARARRDRHRRRAGRRVGRAARRRCATWSRSRGRSRSGWRPSCAPTSARASGGWRSSGEHGLGGILADDMGLGKTLQTLALIAARPAAAAATPARSSWSRRRAWCPPGRTRPRATRRGCGVGVSESPHRRRGARSPRDDADVVVTSYTLLRLEPDAYVALPWGGLVLDEAQKVKNHQGKTYQSVRRSTCRSGSRSPAPRWRTG